MNRRDLLKLFGAGAVIAPVVEGVALATDHARLIEAPKVEIAAPPKLIECDGREFFTNMSELEVTVFARSKVTNRVMRIDCSAFISGMNYRMPVSGMMMRDVGFTATGPVRMIER